jgi:F-type H+-transporting ATPase subunit delta
MTGDLKELVERAQPDVSERRLAAVYAEALLDAAARQHAVDEVLAELRDLASEVARGESFVRAFFTSGVIGTERREAAIKAAFGDRCHPLVLNFLLVLNEHDRLMLFRTAVEELERLNDLRQRRFRVHVRSAVPLQDDQRERLLGELRQSFRLEPVLEQRIEPDLLGGVIVRVGDWVYDGSVRTQLLNLGKQLRESSSHAIQSQRDRFSADEGDRAVPGPAGNA